MAFIDEYECHPSNYSADLWRTIVVQRWVGIVVSGDKATVVDAEIGSVGPIVLVSDSSWSLQKGARSSAYCVMHQRVGDYLRENGIKRTVIKASALSTGSTKLAHLAAAELRGIVIAAAASNTEVELMLKAQISRTFGTRKVDEYVADDSFWKANVAGCALRSGSREAAMLLLAARS